MIDRGKSNKTLSDVENINKNLQSFLDFDNKLLKFNKTINLNKTVHVLGENELKNYRH